MKKTFTFFTLVTMILVLLCSCGSKTRSNNNEEPLEQNGFQYEILEDGTAKIVKYDVHDYQETLDIPDKLGASKVTVIGEEAFAGSDRLQQVKFPAYLTKIEKKAFSGSSLRIAFMTSCRNLVSIGEEAFADCEKLVQVDISSSVTEIGKNAFANDKALVVLTFRGDLGSLKTNMFTDMNPKVKVWTYDENENVKKFFEDNGYGVHILPRS